MRNGAPPSRRMARRPPAAETAAAGSRLASRQDAGAPGSVRDWLINLLTFGRKRRRRRHDVYLLR